MSRSLAYLQKLYGSTDGLQSALQVTAFIVAFGILIAGIKATTMFAASPYEIFVGVMISGILAISLITLGMVLPHASGSQRP